MNVDQDQAIDSLTALIHSNDLSAVSEANAAHPDTSTRAINIINALNSIRSYKSSPLSHSSLLVDQTSLPSLESLSATLASLASTPKSTNTSPPTLQNAELYFVYQTIQILEAHLGVILLEASSSLPEASIYWRDTEFSDWKTIVHILETIPSRLLQVGSQFLGVAQQQQGGSPFTAELWKSLTDSLNWSWKKPALVGTLGVSLLKPLSVLEIARKGIRKRRATLAQVLEMEAGCLGMIAEEREGLRISSVEIGVVGSSLKRVWGIVSRLEGFCTSGVVGSEKHVDFADENISISTIPSLLQTTSTLTQKLLVLQESLTNLSTQLGPPSAFTRLWLPTTLTLLTTYTLSKSYSINAAYISRVSRELVSTLSDFGRNWILEPLYGIYNTVRHKERRLALMGSQSLHSDLESLERMVVDFAKDHGVADLESVRSGVGRGDMTAVMQTYESEMKKPFVGTLKGDLVRAVLIQVQKAKVDLELAMSALDQLLRSNELNFAFLAVIPSLLVAYFAGSYLQNLWKRRKGFGKSRKFEVIRFSLREIEKLLNKSASVKLTHTQIGLLLCELHSLKHSIKHIPQKYRVPFAEDLDELGSYSMTVAQRLSTVQRMGRLYPFCAVSMEDL
ncbi:Nuclear control of ATPase protein 2 [Chytridiales sp. JEL 0842]|nr:Nuclear control of ATPase protein 2 [Chytridiales sp. JEL 0842]